jgi:GMP synthase-like glutamine amidotransferase
LPAGALRLGGSAACGEQGFLVEGKCLALQFHLEMDAGLVRQTVEGSSDYALWPKGEYVQPPKAILADAETYGAVNRKLLDERLDGFFR